MTPSEELANADHGRAPHGQVSDEELDTVTGGLLRPLDPHGHEDLRIGGGSESRNDDTTDD